MITFFLDGSYITEKEQPGDYDCTWDPTGVTNAIDPEILGAAQRESLQSELKNLSRQVEEYNLLKAGNVTMSTARRVMRILSRQHDVLPAKIEIQDD